MSKIILVALLVVCAAAVQGGPIPENEIVNAIIDKNWAEVQKLMNELYQVRYTYAQPEVARQLAAPVDQIQPVGNGHVYGESDSSYQGSYTINGKTYSQAGGHKLINDNGKVYQYDYVPNNGQQ